MKISIYELLEEFLKNSMEKNGGMVAYTFHLSIQETNTDRLIGVDGQSRLERDLISKSHTKTKQYSKLLKECTYKTLVRIF